MGIAEDGPADHPAAHESPTAAATWLRRRIRPGHTVRPNSHPALIVGAVAGLAAVLAAIWLGTAALIGSPPSTRSAEPTLGYITVSAMDPIIPLTNPDIVALLDRSPDYGQLSDPQRRASCLAGLSYPGSTRVLGARPIQINGHPAVLLVLPGDSPATLTAFAVAPNCNAADTGLLADTVVNRP